MIELPKEIYNNFDGIPKNRWSHDTSSLGYQKFIALAGVIQRI
jgi:hypothetical protein